MKTTKIIFYLRGGLVVVKEIPNKYRKFIKTVSSDDGCMYISCKQCPFDKDNEYCGKSFSFSDVVGIDKRKL